MCADATSRVAVSQTFSASPERVFDAFQNVDIARRFLFATPAGDMIAATIDARVGGKFEFIEPRPEMGDVRHIGEYLEIDRPRRLVFTFSAPQFDPRKSVVVLEIRPDADGCEASLIAESVVPDYAERTREGWRRILAGLLAAYDGGYAAGWR